MPMLEMLQARVRKQIICCPDESPHVEVLKQQGFTWQELNISSRPAFANLLEALRIYIYLKREKPDAVVFHQPMAALVGIPAAAAAGVSKIIYSTGGLKFVPGKKSLANEIFRRVEFWLIKLSDAVFLVNHEDLELLKNVRDSRVSEKAIWVGPKGGSGVDTALFNVDYRKENYLKARESLIADASDTFIIGFAGRCVWEKGFRELIDACEILQRRNFSFSWKVAVLGDGQDLRDIQAYARDRGVESRFLFVGYKTDLRFYLSGFDVYVLPSYREGLPVALLEAMALGVPCIASRVRGSSELIDHEKTGLLFDVRDAEGLAVSLERMMMDYSYATRLGKEAADKIAGLYSEEYLLPRTIEILEQIIALETRNSLQ